MASSEPVTTRGAWPMCATLAMAVPALVAFNLPPSATFFNQAAALVGWGGFLSVVAAGAHLRSRPRGPGLAALFAAFALLLAASLGPTRATLSDEKKSAARKKLLTAF